ncbi:MAG TPA: cell division protein, partial [Chromatiaceae bacterium]|nr:cell division protein [Chromatiaceae bacterium]
MRKRRHSRSLRGNINPRAWLLRNLQALIASLGRLRQRPLGNLMSILVISIAMALPTGLYLLVDNLQRLSQGWQGTASATLFLVPGVSDRQVSQLIEQLQLDPAIASLRHLDPDQALAEFRRHSGLAEALELLEENPLPHVILLQMSEADVSRQALSLLLQSLKSRPEVESAAADLDWVSRFQAMVN